MLFFGGLAREAQLGFPIIRLISILSHYKAKLDLLWEQHLPQNWTPCGQHNLGDIWLTAIWLGTDTSTVLHTLENRIAVFDDRATRYTLDMRNQPYAATVVLVGRVIKTRLCVGRSCRWIQ